MNSHICKFPSVLRNIILTYLPDRELLPWIDESLLVWECVSTNPAAIQYIEENLDKVDWNNLSSNSAAIHLLEANMNKINWYYLSRNPAAIHLLEANQDKLDWYGIARNPNAENLITHNPTKMFFHELVKNTKHFHYCVSNPEEWFDEESGASEYTYELRQNRSDEVFNLLYENMKCVEGGMYANPLAIKYIDLDMLDIDADMSKENRHYLSKNPAAIDLLTTNPDKIDWYTLSGNPAAAQLLEINQDKIDWDKFSANPGIFKPVPKSEIEMLL